MSEDLHNIDDLFKKALEENTELPSSTVWDNIDKSLDKKKVISISKKYNKLKWAAAILLLFSLAMAMYALHIRKQNRELVKQNNEGNKISNQKTQSNINIKDSFNISARTLNNEKKYNAKILADKNHTPDSSILVVNKSPDKEYVASNDKASSANSIEKNKTTSTPLKDNQAIHITSANEENKIAALQDKTEFPAKNKGATITKTSAKTGSGAVINGSEVISNKKRNASNITAMNKRFSSTIKAPEIYNETNINNDGLNNITQEKNIDRITFLPELKSDALISTQSQLLQINKDALSNIKTENIKKSVAAKRPYLKKNNHSLFSITAFYSPDLVSTEESDDDDHQRFREEEKDEIEKDEKIKFSSTVGLLFNYNFGSRWKLESGVTYSSRTTDIMPKTIYARPDNNGNINYRFNCSAGYSYITVKSAPMPVSGDSINALSSRNTLNYIGVPVAIRYVFTKGKWNFIPAIGMSFNFLTKGDIRTTIEEPTTGDKNAILNKIQGLKSSYINGMIGFAAQYNLNKTLAVTFEPTTRFALSSINNDAPVKTNLNSFGFVTGLVIKL